MSGVMEMLFVLIGLIGWRGFHACALHSPPSPQLDGIPMPMSVGVLPGPPWRQGGRFECLLPAGADGNVHTSSVPLP